MLEKLKSLFAQSFVYTIGNFITKASGLYLIPLYAFYLTKAEFGLLAMYETTFMFIQVLCGWGVKGGFTRWFNEMKSRQEQKSLFFTSYVFNVFTSILGVVLTAVVISHINLFKGVDSEKIILLFSISSLLKLLYDVPFILLKLQQKAIKQTAFQSLNVVLTIAFTFYFLELMHFGFEGVFWAQVFANGLTLISVIPLIINNCHVRFQRKVLGQMIHYGYPLAISNILTMVLTISDRYILEAYYSLEDVGSFSVAFKVANLLQFLIVTSFVTSYTYQYYKSLNDDGGSRYHIKIFTYFMLFMVGAGLGIVLFGKEIVYVIMAGKTEYYDAIPVIPLLIVGLIFSGMRQIFILPLTKAKKTKLISIVLILAGALNVGLNFIVIPDFGKEGAALSTAVSQLLAAIWLYYQLQKIEDSKYEWKKVFIVFVLGTVFCTAYLMLPNLSVLVDWLVKFAILVSFAVSLMLLGFFEPIEIERLKQALSKWKKPNKFIKNMKDFNS